MREVLIVWRPKTGTPEELVLRVSGESPQLLRFLQDQYKASGRKDDELLITREILRPWLRQCVIGSGPTLLDYSTYRCVENAVYERDGGPVVCKFKQRLDANIRMFMIEYMENVRFAAKEVLTPAQQNHHKNLMEVNKKLLGLLCQEAKRGR